VLRVSVKTDAGPAPLPVAGRYDIRNGAIRFTPMVPFEPGRSYDVAFNPAALPGGGLAHLQPISSVVSVPGPPASPPVRVAAVYPTGPEVPENLLRMYVAFSGPMGSRDGRDYVTLVDGQGRDMDDALLPLDTGLWNPERTRFTVLFDPGRVKRGILPNRASGRPLKAGGTFAIVVRRAWPDAHGKPMVADFRQEFRVGPAIERPLDPAAWRIAPPAAGSKDPLVVSFPWPLDRGLLARSLQVAGSTGTIDGTATVEDGEIRWRFTPAQPWTPGAHTLVALPELEDACGNRIGRAFETDDTSDDTRIPPHRIPFTVAPR
jgi:hypothetical protein